MTWEAVAGEAAEDRLLPWKRVRELTSLSRTTAWRLQKAGEFPAPVAISPGRVGWREREVAAWNASRRPRGAAPAAPRTTAARPPETVRAVLPAAVAPITVAPADDPRDRAPSGGRQMRLDF